MTDLIRMSELARRSGVPAATIKHYIREGLLPGPARKSGRTMAYYDPALVDRVHAIKDLQRRRFLPLSVIKDVLDGADPYRTEETQAALEKALQEPGDPEDARTRAQLIGAGMPAEQLDFFESVGLVRGEGEGDSRRYTGDDLALLRTLGAARREGLSPEMLPHTIVATYLEAVQNLAKAELAMFQEGMLAADPNADVDALVGSAAKLSEQLVVLLRRKMLVPMLRRLVEERGEKK